MLPTPQSNVERYLSVIAGHGGEIPSEPASRAEYYLNKIVENGGIGGKLKPKVVASLPATGETGLLYLVPADGSGKNLYDEYIWIEEETRFELLGQTKIDIDLSDYVQKTRKVGGKPLSADVGISVTGTSPIKVTDNGTASAIGYSVIHEDSGVTAGSKGDATNQTPSFGGTFKVLSVTVDAKGHVTALGDHTAKIPDAEATQSAKGLMSPADKTKLDTLIDSTLSNTGKAADAKATGDAITFLRDYLKSMEIHRNASGNPARFSDAAAENVKDLCVTITPTQSGSGTPSPSNIRPITGLQSISTTRTGKNLLKTLNVSNQYVKVNADGSVEMIQPAPNNQSFIMGHAQLKGGTAYKLTWPISSSFRVFIGIDGEFTGPDTDNMGIFTPSYDQKSEIGLVYGNVAAGTKMYPMVYISDNPPSEYEPYQGQSVTVSLVDSNSNPLTVYGGTLNVTTGELTVTHANIASYNGETLPGRWISDRDVYTPGTVPTTGAQVVYELASPATYQLTPAQLATLSGYNSVSTDAERVDVTYKADTSLVLGGGV